MVDSIAFSTLNRKKFLDLATNTKFDFVFTTCGFKEALFGLLASEMGYKCAILCNDDFTCNLHPVVDTKDASKKLIIELRNRFPHLILPDEYLNIRPVASRLKALFSGAIREKDILKYESLLKTTPGDLVSLDQEFKMSSHRLLISILKSAVKAGVIVLNHIQTEKKSETELIVSDLKSDEENSYKLSGKQFLHCNPAKEESEKEELHFLLNRKGLFLKRSLKFRVNDKLVRLIRYQDYFLVICESNTEAVGFVRSILEKLNQLLDWDDQFDEDDIIACEKVQVSSQGKLNQELKHLERLAKQYLKLSSSQFEQQISSLNVIDSNFEGRIEIQQLIEFADFRFDEAKQTGIDPISFKNLFYQFGSEIEQLTEKAYELRPEFGPGSELWGYVQLWYMFHFEMLCCTEDYYSRLGSLKVKSFANSIVNKQFIEARLHDLKSKTC